MLTDKTETAGSPVPLNAIKSRKVFWIFLGFVLVSRLVIWAVIHEHPQSFFEVDSPSYIDPAEALIADGRYDTEPGSHTPETLRPPGYPLWLALIFRVFGKSANAVVFFQIFLFLGTLTLTFALTEQMFGRRSAWVAVILLALDPSSMSHTFKILSETLAAFFTVAFAYCVFGFYRTQGKLLFGGGAGLCLALATLVRPTTYYFIPVLLVAFAMFLIRGQFKWKTILSGLLVTFLPFLIVVGSWQWRNLETAGIFKLTSVQGWALYLGKGAQIYSEKHQVPFGEAESILRQQLDQTHPESKHLPIEQLDDVYLAEGWRWVRENPGLAVQTHLTQMLYFFLAPGTTSAFFRLFDPDFKTIPFNWYQKGTYFAELVRDHKRFLFWILIGTAYLVILYTGVAAWIVQMWRGREDVRWLGMHALIFLLVLYIAAASGINYGQDRYRIVVMPLLCLYAGAGFPGILNYIKSLMERAPRAA